MSLFGAGLAGGTLGVLARRMAQLSDGGVMMGRRALPGIRGASVISDFVGPRSAALFGALGVAHSFLALSSWGCRPGCHSVETAVVNFIG